MRLLALSLLALAMALAGCRPQTQGPESDEGPGARPKRPEREALIDLGLHLDGYARARRELGQPFTVVEIRDEGAAVVAVVDQGRGEEEARWSVSGSSGRADLRPANNLAEVLSGGGR